MLAVKIQGWHFINSIKSSERLPAPNGAGSKKIGTGLDMGYMKFQLLEHKLNRYGFKQF